MAEPFDLAPEEAVRLVGLLRDFKARHPRGCVSIGTPADWNGERRAKRPSRRHPEGVPARPYEVFVTTDDEIGTLGHFFASIDSHDLASAVEQAVAEVEAALEAAEVEAAEAKALGRGRHRN